MSEPRLIDARDLDSDIAVTASVCVIGSGVAGATVAVLLARAGVDVILVEAGGRRVEKAAEQAQEAGPESTYPERLNRVMQRRLGGSTWMWGGRCLPLDELDLEDRPGVRGGWPISYDQIAGHLPAAARILDVDQGPWSLPAALPPDEAAAVDDTRAWRWSHPLNFWSWVSTELPRLPRLRVLHHAPVVELVQPAAGGPVTAARVHQGPGRELRVEAARFVVAGGGIDTARLLLASRGGTDAGLGNAHDQVGRHFMIHPVAAVGRLSWTDPELARTSEFQRQDGIWMRRMLTLRPEVLRAEGLLASANSVWYPEPRDAGHGDALLSSYALVRAGLARAGGFKATGIHQRYAKLTDGPQHVRNVVTGAPGLAAFGAFWARHRWAGERQVPAFNHCPPGVPQRLRFDAEQRPDPDNRVTLSREVDELGMPRLVVTHRVSAEDRASIVRGLDRIGSDLHRRGLATWDLPEREALLTDHPIFDATHQMGLTRMSASPTAGVVDADCRLHEVPNTWVAGPGVFATSGMAGPVMTTVALAVRLAEHLVRTP